MPSAIVVDDSRETANSLVQWLELLSYEALAALGPRQALEALARRLPDVIFLDIHMQGVEGVEVCRFIRRDPRTARVIIVAMSSDTQPALIQNAREAGADGFLPKPIEFEMLEQVLQEVKRRTGPLATVEVEAAV